MHAEQRERAQALLAARGLERALFAGRASLLWLTGFTFLSIPLGWLLGIAFGFKGMLV